MPCKSKLIAKKWHISMEEKFIIPGTQETGQLHFFYHCPESDLPIRDVVHRKKSEPHIEKNAENYCVGCYQNLIRKFLRSPSRYLFLVTTCRKKDSEHRGKYFVVGYILKENSLRREYGWAVQGSTKMVSFHAAFCLHDLTAFSGVFNFRHMRKDLGPEETKAILKRLKSAPNILPKCIREIGRLGKLGWRKKPCK